MENELLKMKRNAVMLGLCGEYSARWNSATDKRQLMDIALDANGVEFMCEGCADGWGLSTEFLLREFGDYVNGRYALKKNGYTSAMFVGINRSAEEMGYNGLVLTTTLSVFIDCDMDVYVPKYAVCKMYVCRGCRLRIECDGRCDVYVYGKDSGITASGEGTLVRHEAKRAFGSHRKY